MSGNASQRKGDRKQGDPEARENETVAQAPVEKAGKRFTPDHTGRRKPGSGFGNAAGQLGTAFSGEQERVWQDVHSSRSGIDETQTEQIRPGQSG